MKDLTQETDSHGTETKSESKDTLPSVKMETPATTNTIKKDEEPESSKSPPVKNVEAEDAPGKKPDDTNRKRDAEEASDDDGKARQDGDSNKKHRS